MKSIILHTDHCVSSGSCVEACPDVFGVDEYGLVALVDPHPPAALWPNVEQAALACPASVIEVVDDGSAE
jgi:ferredoxin